MYYPLVQKLKTNYLIIISIIFIFSCVDKIYKPTTQKINIIESKINLNRFNNELFLQIHVNEESRINIKDVFMELTYNGSGSNKYNKIFELYDNGENGDIIKSNGIYTLITVADTIDLPEIDPYMEIIMEDNFMLNKSTSDSLNVSVIINGKPFLIKSMICDQYNDTTFSHKNINLDNSYIELLINTEYMYLDDKETNICDRSYNENPNPNLFQDLWVFLNGTNTNNDLNQFLFNTLIPFRSISDCGGTGKVIFRFILNDLDTMSQITNDIELIIYGCGDGICEENFETQNTCPIDCQ